MKMRQLTLVAGIGLGLIFWSACFSQAKTPKPRPPVLPQAASAGPDRMVSGKPLSEWTARLMSANEDASGQARDVLMSAKLTRPEFEALLNTVVAFLAGQKDDSCLAVGENLVWIISAMGDQGRAGLPFIRKMADAPYESEAVQIARELFKKLDPPLEVRERGSITPPADGEYAGLEAADITGDQNDEIIAAASTPRGLFFQIVSAAPDQIYVAWDFDTQAALAPLYAGDINNDGRCELGCRSRSDEDRAVFYGLNPGPGAYLKPFLKSEEYRGVRFGTAMDITQDQRHELLEFIAAPAPENGPTRFDVRVCRLNHDPERMGEVLPRFPGPEGIKKICCGDIDGDRQREVVCEIGPGAAGGEVAVLFHRKGAFVFTEEENLSHSEDPKPFLALACFDADSDRKDELIKLEPSGYYIYKWEGDRFREISRRWYDGTAAECCLLRVRSREKPDALLLAYRKNPHDRAWHFREIKNILPEL